MNLGTGQPWCTSNFKFSYWSESIHCQTQNTNKYVGRTGEEQNFGLQCSSKIIWGNRIGRVNVTLLFLLFWKKTSRSKRSVAHLHAESNVNNAVTVTAVLTTSKHRIFWFYFINSIIPNLNVENNGELYLAYAKFSSPEATAVTSTI